MTFDNIESQKALKASDIFKCIQCGDCCIGYGGTYVTQKDIKAIAKYINVTPEKFIDKYCSISGKRFVLAQGQDGRCIFWDKLCTIHPVKPRMCAAWPFIENVLKEPENWNIMANSCPGIQKDVPYDQLKKCVKKEIEKLNQYRQE